MADTRSPRIDRAIDAARAAVGSPEQVARLRARLAPQLGAAGDGLTAAAPAQAALLHGKVGLAIIALAAAGSLWIAGREPQPSAAPVVPPQVEEAVTTPVVVVAAPLEAAPQVASAVETKVAEVARRVRTRTVARRVPPPAAAASPVDPGSEIELISQAQASVARQPEAALAAIERHAASFPNGLLSEEREILRVDAEWALGRRAPALAHARRFVETYPHSAQTRRFQQLLSEHADDHKIERDGTRTE